MNLLKASSGPARPRRAALVLVAAVFLLQGGAALAQCTLNGSIAKFEPNPPGESRPSYMNWIEVNGFYLNQPPGGQPRLLVSEVFGYHVVDLSNPASPSAIGWEDYRFSPSNPGPVPCNGDCHSGLSAYGISDDGARAGFVGGNGVGSERQFGAIIGSTSGTNWQISLKGETPALNANGIVVQRIAGRYLAYTFSRSEVYVSDVTNLPAALVNDNLAVERVLSAPGGAGPVLAGPYLAYMNTLPAGQVTGAISLTNVGSPGPVGNISSGFSTYTIGATDWGRPATEKPYSFHAAADPSNGSAIYVLAEFANTQNFQSAGYSLIRFLSGTATVVGTFRIPAAGGETWGLSYTVGLHQSGGSLFALMWGSRSAPSALFRLYSTPVAAFGGQAPGAIDVDPAQYQGFGTGQRMAGLEAQNKLFLYVPSGNSGWVVPTSCVSTNSPAVSTLSVSSYGAPLSSGATVFLGDKIDIAAGVAPAPGAQPLTGFRWNFDFDFHSGNATEDAGTTPRIKQNDNGVFGNPQDPPAAITLWGPCDFKSVPAGDPSTGAGCWNSVKTNSAAGGPDFTGAEAAGAMKSLAFAMEANNQYGSGGTTTFDLNWKVPAAKLVSTQVLSSQPLVQGSDGHPTATGFKWYFGDAQTSLVQSGCTGGTCVPALQARGTHYYWLTATYANGYATPDYAGTAAMGTYEVTDYAPAFTVNGAAAGPITAITNSSLSVVNSSQHGAGITATYEYNLCLSPCGADAWAAWPAMTDPPTSGSPATSAGITVPGVVGTYHLKIKVSYTGGTTYWPDPANVGTFALNVTNVVPEIRFNCVIGFQCTDINSVSVNTNDVVSAYAYVNGGKDSNPPPGLAWTMNGASPGSCFGPSCQPATFSYGSAGTYTVTMNGYGSPVNATVTVTQRATPPSVSASASPSSAAVNQQVSFSCSAFGGTGNYSYSWSFGDGYTGSGSSTSHAYAGTGNYTASCTARDTGTNLTGQGNVTVSVGSGGGGPSGFCNVNNFFYATISGGGQFPDTPFVGGGFAVGAGTPITFIAPPQYVNYQWNFGDGQIVPNSTATVTHTYATPGTRTIALTADGCTKSYPIAITGPAGPTLNCSGTTFTVQGATYQPQDQFGTPAGWRGIGVGTSTTFVATNPSTAVAATQDWNWGDGTPHGSGQTAAHAYASAGTYTVTLTVTATDGAGASGACTSSFDAIVEGPSGSFVTRYEDNSLFVASNVLGFKNVVFTASHPAGAGVGYLWDFGDGTAHGASQTVTHSFAPGTWIVRLTVTSGLGNATATQPLTVVAPPEPPKWVVPGMAYVLGQVPGSVWQSDVTILNPDPTRTATYSVALLDARSPVDDGSKLVWSPPIQVPALGSVSSPNLLGDTFGQPLGSYGALLVRGDVAPMPPVITARTFNNGDPAKGTFGLSVPSASASSGGVTSQASTAASVLIGLRQNADAYTNLGLVNLKNEWPKVRLEFLDGLTAAPLGTTTVDLMPYQSLQINRALLAAGFAGTSDLYTVKVKILQGTAVYPYATVIDANSTDPIVVTPSEAPSTAYRLPGIVRLAGANGEQWRSRVTVSNPSSSSRKVTMAFSYVPCDANGCRSRVSITGDIAMSPGQSQSWDDFVRIWLSVKGDVTVDDAKSYASSFLDVAPAAGDAIQEPLVVLGETYNATPNGHVGLQIPGYSPQDGASRAGAYKRLVLTGLASTATYRTNLALFVVAGANARWVSVHVYSPQGTKLRDIPVQVDGFSQVSSATLFGGLPGDLARLSVVVDNLDEGVTVGGYATIIDNTSGDATFVKAQPAP